MNSFESSNESQTDLEGEDYSSYFTSKNKSNNVLNEDEKIKINNNMLISDNDSIKKIENEKNNESKNNNNYYKVNLTKIHFLIYDFDKDSIVEHKDNNNISKIEKIIKDLSKNVYTDFGKDENYPIIHLKTKLINNEKKDKFIQKEKENFNKEEKIIEEKLKTEINNNKDEISIKNLKLLLLISYIFMLVCGIVNIYLYLNFYSTFKKIFNMIHTTANIKYWENISIYYVREIALLSFNIKEIVGGEYVNFPAKNKTNYLSLIKSKLNELFIENQNSIKKILFSSIYCSENTVKLYKENVIKLNIALNPYNIGELFNLLVQYNNEFYYFVQTNNQINYNDENVYNYIQDNFNKYRVSIELLIHLYENEMNLKKNKFITISITFYIIVFILFVSIYIYIYKYFILSNKKRINYIKLLYGINSNALKTSIKESLNLINNLKDSYDKNDFEYEEENNNFINKLGLIDNKENKNKNERNNMKSKINYLEINGITNNNILFFILFGLILLLFYFYFINDFLHLLKIFKKSENIFLFAYNFQSFQLQIIDMFNIYREYLYDKDSKITNYKSIDFLKNLENEIYDTFTENKKITNAFIEQLISSYEDVSQVVTQNFCFENVTGYFDSYEECNNKFQFFLKYNFYVFSNYFLEEIKIKKILSSIKMIMKIL